MATATAWARQFAVDHPILLKVLRAFALVAGAVVAVTALIAIFDPVPGDEMAAGAAAVALVTFALHGVPDDDPE